MSARGPAIAKRSLTIAGHRTSISLEEPFWRVLTRIAGDRGLSVPSLVAEIDKARAGRNLSSAIRIFVLDSVSSPDEPGPRT